MINVLTDIIWRTTVAFYADNITCKLIKYLQVNIISFYETLKKRMYHKLGLSGEIMTKGLLVITAILGENGVW